jgi:hypothetical protein
MELLLSFDVNQDLDGNMKVLRFDIFTVMTIQIVDFCADTAQSYKCDSRHSSPEKGLSSSPFLLA